MSRFSEPQHPVFRRLNASIGFDRRLWPQDVRQSKAHARALLAAGILDEGELDALHSALDQAASELGDGRFELRDDDEDIHMAVERRVTEIAGPVGGKLHTGRSRNDQVATDVALYVRERCERALELIGALAARLWELDREAVARELGFEGIAANSLDAVASRDAVLDYLSAASICATHLSRLGTEIVLWSSEEFGFAEPSDDFASGSSIMPQKKNPDAAELLRAKAPRIAADYATLIGVLHGLPLAYSKDLQEDKEALFDAADNLELCLEAAAGMLRGISFRRERLAAAAADEFLAATDVADLLVRR